MGRSMVPLVGPELAPVSWFAFWIHLRAGHPMLWLHCVKLILARNSWMDEIQCLPVTDAQWLLEASVYIAVEGPLWLSSEEPLTQDIVLPTTQSVLGTDL